MAKSPLARAARALCSLAGTPDNTTFEGKPMWQSYLPQARAVLLAVKESGASVTAAGGEQISTQGFKIGAQVAACTWDRMIGAILEGK